MPKTTMPIILGSDLQGQTVKESVKKLLTQAKADVFDMGFVGEQNISRIGDIVHNYPNWVAIVFCKNASCLSILLNKYTNVRSIVAHTDEQDIFMARNRHGANVMCFPMDSQNLLPRTLDLISTFVTA